jgi:hypothetical protein
LKGKSEVGRGSGLAAEREEREARFGQTNEDEKHNEGGDQENRHPHE